MLLRPCFRKFYLYSCPVVLIEDLLMNVPHTASDTITIMTVNDRRRASSYSNWYMIHSFRDRETHLWLHKGKDSCLDAKQNDMKEGQTSQSRGSTLESQFVKRINEKRKSNNPKRSGKHLFDWEESCLRWRRLWSSSSSSLMMDLIVTSATSSSVDLFSLISGKEEETRACVNLNQGQIQESFPLLVWFLHLHCLSWSSLSRQNRFLFLYSLYRFLGSLNLLSTIDQLHQMYPTCKVVPVKQTTSLAYFCRYSDREEEGQEKLRAGKMKKFLFQVLLIVIAISAVHSRLWMILSFFRTSSSFLSRTTRLLSAIFIFFNSLWSRGVCWSDTYRPTAC